MSKVFPATRRAAVSGLLLSVLATQTGSATAAVFCVDTLAELQSALVTAQSNSQDDVIRVSVGVYQPASRLDHVTSEAHSLAVEGGYFLFCGARFEDPSLTVIDGSLSSNGVANWASSNTASDMHVRNLTFTSPVMQPVNAVRIRGGGLTLVENMHFREIAAGGTADFAVALQGSATGSIVVRNNLFTGNLIGRDHRDPQRVTSENAAVDRAGLLSGNTVVGNGVTGDVFGSTGALSIQGLGRWVAVNNIFWGNDIADLDGGAQTLFGHNDIGVNEHGNADPQSAGNLSVDPRLDAELRLQPGSPLIDAGTAAYSLAAGVLDAFGQARAAGSQFDIGAFEYPGVFADGCE